MTLDDLITLITAGFTKDEILTMSGTAPQRAPQPQPQPQAYPQTQQIQQISEQNDVLSALKSLTSAVQSNNVNLMQNTVPKQVTTEDAIASIINPPNYDGLTGGEK